MVGGASFDVAVIGGGIMGCSTALHLAENGMRVVVLERGSLCRGASGVNAGTLSLQFVEIPLVPYARRGRELWHSAAAWLGADVGFVPKGVITLAFGDDEAEALRIRMAERAAAGAATEVIGIDRIRAIEPAITARATLAAYSPLDGLANANLLGLAFGAALKRAGVVVCERSAVTGVAADASFAVRVAGETVRARRIVLAGGAWLAGMGHWLGVDLRFGYYVNQMIVSERMPKTLGSTVGVMRRMLTLKQTPDGTFLIGGGWQAEGRAEDEQAQIIPRNFVSNLRLARHVLPTLRSARLLRSWIGFQDRPPDGMPVIGPLPGVANAFVIGCGLSGFTMGLFLGRLLAQAILGREPEMPLFDPTRLLALPPGPPPPDPNAFKRL